MQELFNNYLDNTFFGEYKQSQIKIKQFDFNYRKYFPDDLDSKILDIGIGRGEMLTCLKNLGYNNYLGIDISQDTIKFCKSLKLNCLHVNNTVNWLNENKKSFSFITLLDVLEHIKKETTIEFLKAIKNSLTSQGVLIIQVPNSQAPDSSLIRYDDFTHETGFTEHSLNQILISVGFEDIFFQGFEQFTNGKLHDLRKKIFRKIFWKYVKFTRKINSNHNPYILNPVFYCIVKNI